MSERWDEVAEHVMETLSAQPGEAIHVRDRTGRYDVLRAMLLAIERRGATPLPDLLPGDYLERLLTSTDPAVLATWDRHRLAWGEKTDRALVLGQVEADLATAPRAAVDAWRQAVDRLTLLEHRRRVPYLLVAVPTAERARQLGLSLADLEDAVLPAVTAKPEALRREVDRALAALREARTLTIRSGSTCVLHLDQGGRRWLSDTGTMPFRDEQTPKVQPVLNLPAGAVYTTTIESATHGSLWLPRAGVAREVVLHFEGGRVASIEAAHGADTLAAMLDRHSGEPRRVSHIGIGLNPYLQRSTGWTLVDEHRHGYLLIALGENRYLGGENESTLNVDFAIPDATLLADGRAIVANGRLVV